MTPGEYLQLAAAVATGLGSLFGLIKMGFGEYIKKVKEVESIRKKNNDEAIDSLKTVTESITKDLKAAQVDIKNVQIVCAKVGAKIESLSTEYSELRLEMHPLIEALKRKVRKQDNDKTGVKDLGQNFYRVEKKPGSKE